MDAVAQAEVEVTGLHVPGSPPHLELLCYRGRASQTPTGDADIAATQLVFSVPRGTPLEKLDCERSAFVTRPDGEKAELLRDPDGHRLWLVAEPV